MNAAIDSPAPADINCAQDRAALRLALVARGITAHYSSPGGDLNALEVTLVPDNGREALWILIISLDMPCEVGLSGFRTENGVLIDCASAENLRPETPPQAAEAVQRFWEGRDAFIRDFRAGHYDLGEAQ